LKLSTDAAIPARALRWLAPACISLALAACAWGAAYLYFATPGPWMSSVPSQRFYGVQMTLSRGSGRVDGARFVLQATDAAGLAIVSLDTPALLASDYRRMRWTLSGAQADVALATLWRTDSAPGKIIDAPLESSNEGAQALLTPGERNWIGRIGGIALTVRGTLRQPLIIESVSLDPMGVGDVVADRMRDWLAFTPWNGLSINTAFGGPLEQPVWLPLAAAIVALTAIALCVAWRRWRTVGAYTQFPLTILAIVAAAWITLDARWLWARLQQTEATAAIFSGKSSREKHIADLDGYVYAFAEQVRARLPKTPARIYVTADDHYFGARMAYHLYPHNAYVDHGSGTLPPSERCKPGEFIVVFRRHGVTYDTAQQMLRWDDQPPVHAQLLLAHLGNAVFKLL
jgi:hypothetical protein